MKYLYLLAILLIIGCTPDALVKSYNHMVVVDPNDGKHYLIQYNSNGSGYDVVELNIPLGTPCNTVTH